jgi:K+-sensing histidine kinase KdpD
MEIPDKDNRLRKRRLISIPRSDQVLYSRTWVGRLVLPTTITAAATVLTLWIWPNIRPTASPLFFLAVMISSIYGGVTAGLLSAALSTVATAYFFMSPEFSFRIESTADVFRLMVFGMVALLTNSIAAERNRAEADQRQLIDDLRLANSRIRILSDLLPTCPDCKRVQVSSEWKSLERYLAETPGLQISYALCPDCSARNFPEFQPAALKNPANSP